MSLTRWMVCMLAGVLSLGMVVKADDHKEDKKHEKLIVLPAPVKAAWDARYKGVEVVKIEDKKDCFEIKGKDALNDGFKVVIGLDGKLWSENKRKVVVTSCPPAVIETAHKWAPEAKWNEHFEVETKKSSPSTWEVVGVIGEKKYKAHIAEDGKVIKADKLPDIRKEEKREEKHEEKKEEKREEKK